MYLSAAVFSLFFLSSSTSWNVGSESGSVGAGKNYGLIKNNKAYDTTSYLIIRLVSAINTQWAYITNINVNIEKPIIALLDISSWFL